MNVFEFVKNLLMKRAKSGTTRTAAIGWKLYCVAMTMLLISGVVYLFNPQLAEWLLKGTLSLTLMMF